jgi:hypothetical protein
MQAAHMTSSQYDGFHGILAHLHAPKPSTHGDVALNIRSLKAKIDKILAPPVPPVPPAVNLEEEMVLVRLDGTKPVYKTDGFTRQHVGPKQYAGLKKAGFKDVIVADNDELNGYGPEVPNPVPAV